MKFLYQLVRESSKGKGRGGGGGGEGTLTRTRKEHTRELISARDTHHKYNNKDLSRLQ